MSGSILNIGSLAVHDDSIIKKEYYPYTPFTTSLGINEEIRIAIHNQDAYLLPSESYIYMQIAATTVGANAAGDADVRFVTNFASYLFSDARYELNGVEIDRVRNVGRASTMKLRVASRSSKLKSYASYTSALENTTPVHNEARLFDVTVPLSVWFGFCDDYNKVILNAKHQLVLNRYRDTLNCVEGGGAGADTARVTFELRQLIWKMPHVTLADGVKLKMLNYLSKNRKITVQHRSMDFIEYPTLPAASSHMWTVKTVSHVHRPRFVVVGLQTNRNSRHTQNAAKFDKCFMKELRLHLNSQIFPYHMAEFDIANLRFSELYEMYSRAQSTYYNNTESENHFALSFNEFQNSPLYVFDTSRADESLIDSSVDIKVEMKASQNTPGQTAAFCLIIYDSEFSYSPFDGIVERKI